MRRTLYATVALSMLLSGCKVKELAEKAKIARDLNKSGSTINLMKNVADDKYTPPADGKLTDNQIKMYLKVREHEKAIVQVAKKQFEDQAKKADKEKNSIAGMMDGFKAMGSAADLVTADIRAAKDLGFNTQEYLWVKGQVIAASAQAISDKMGEAMNAQLEASYQQMKKASDEAKDEQTKKMYAETLAGMEKGRAEMQQAKTADPTVTYNRELLSHYENAIAALVNETAKYSDDPNAQKQAEELTKKIDDAKANAGKNQ
jgi:hypothetical protein